MLAGETGRPLVQHVVDRVRGCRGIDQIIVAADDQRIVDALRPFGTQVVLTAPEHVSGTDRIAEVARTLRSSVIVNVQGDEPEIEPAVVEELAGRIESEQVEMATAATTFPAGADVADPNLVKVVCGLDGRAIYFSRCAIPHRRDADNSAAVAYHLHLGIYAYRRDFLLDFASWAPTPLEQTEKLEQLRAIEHGRPIFVLMVDRQSHGIDTPQQYAAFVRRYKESC
jgi:3-deoxy-manno-octulosonate cytidylyltransferase (CMP-KDO synthetase)